MVSGLAERSVAAVIGAGAIKVCGLREPADAAAAAAAGADLIGFIFAPARRRVTPDQAASAIMAARGATTRPVLAVGVFVDADPEEINRTAADADLDLVQLHGDEDPALLAALSRPAVKAIRPRPGESSAVVAGRMEGYLGADRPPVAFLVDGWDERAPGGTGVRADWTLAADLAARYPVLLAGGLTPENVPEAILEVTPLGVDVSSGVETDGAKDHAKIAAYVAAARRAFGRP